MRIGKLDIEKPLILAPMDDITDRPFRQICRQLGADIVYTEYTSCEALIRSIPKAVERVRITPQDKPVAIQVFGSTVEAVAEAVAVVEQSQPDFIDLNCGCWVKRHALRFEGAGLLKDLPLFEKIVKAAVKATRLPVTVKTRLGWDENSITILEVARMVEQAGAQAIAIHCRTRTQGYKGKADWTWLSKVKQAVSIPVIGNGDVTTAYDVQTLFDLGCDGVMLGRQAVINPWIFHQIKHFLQTGTVPPAVSVAERLQLCIHHLDLMVEDRGPSGRFKNFRKFYLGYIRDFPSAAALRTQLMELNDPTLIKQKLQSWLQGMSRDDISGRHLAVEF